MYTVVYWSGMAMLLIWAAVSVIANLY